VYPTLHGAAVAAREFVEGLSREKFHVELVNTVFNDKLNTLEKASAGKVIKLAKYIAETAQILSFKKVDAAVLIHSFRWSSFYKDTLFIRLCLFFKKRVILYAHGIGFDTLFYDTLSPKRQQYIDRIFKRISDVVVVSQAMEKEYLRWFRPEQIHLIYNVSEPVFFKDEAIDRGNRSSTTILFLSAVTEPKGIFVLLDAFKNLAARHEDLRLIICGSFWDTRPEDKVRYETFLAENDFFKKVEFRGMVSGEDKKKAFKDADIFVLPSLRESFGIVNIEAMSAGLPVVSTLQGAIPEYITEGVNGFLVESGDAAALEKRLEMLINDGALREKIGEHNRRDFFANFTREKFQKLWEKVLLQTPAEKS
jgi:glycosyltransferase involved in cell wall biosynthesis